jgi:ribosome biogenesis protein MAK21
VKCCKHSQALGCIHLTINQLSNVVLSGFLEYANPQVAAHAPSNWAAGALLLLSEVLRAQPGLWAAVQQPEDAAGQAETFTDAAAAADGDAAAAAAAAAKVAAAAMGDSDDEEVFRDVPDSEDEAEGEVHGGKKSGNKAAAGSTAAAAAAANGVAADGAAAAAASADAKWPRSDYYDMRKR